MVYIIVCQKCGEAFEADTASTESICPRCILDQDLESQFWDDGDPDVGLMNDFFTPILWVME